MGQVLARIPAEPQRNCDITGGLPRVAELFESRSSKDAGMLAEVTGTVTFGKGTKGRQRLIITDQEGNSHETLISKDKTVLVHDGQVVQKGDEIVDATVRSQEEQMESMRSEPRSHDEAIRRLTDFVAAQSKLIESLRQKRGFLGRFG